MKQETLSKIEEMAELQFTIDEVAIICEIEPDTIEDRDTPGGLAYIRGRLKAQAVVRKALYEQAVAGSSQAQRQFLLLAEDSEFILEEDQSQG